MGSARPVCRARRASRRRHPVGDPMNRAPWYMRQASDFLALCALGFAIGALLLVVP
jgi:hypothetical protein